MDVNKKILLLRQLMNKKNIDTYIVPSSDSHQSEYTGEHFKCREWISGFTGSAGTVVITADKAILWTDGRYFIQAEEQLKNTDIDLYRMGDADVPSINKYLKDNLNKGETIGFNGKLFSIRQVEHMKDAFDEKEINLDTRYDLIDEIWKDRPELPKGKVFVHDIKYSGASVEDKLEVIRKKLHEKDVDYYLISSLDDIAWTFNIRGYDIEFNPVVISYAIIGKNKASLFIEDEKLDRDVKKHLSDNNIEIKPYEDIGYVLKELPKHSRIYFDPDKTSIWSYENISEEVRKLKGEDIIEKLKAIKNDIEIENFRKCQARDGVAMIKFLNWLDTNIGKNNITEISASKKLEEFRALGENYISLSFDTIAGYKNHAAIVHYSADKNSDYTLEDKGMLLLDSGAQYLDGTTDITRTIVLGELSDEKIRDFTLVLKGHIALSKAKFLYGTTGTHLDTLARIPLWEDGKDYKHGTGHGVGYLLSVHEGPHNISPKYNKTKLEPGMFVTNEPGFYKEGEYGIRTENILLVKEKEETEHGRFMEFETTTVCPIDLRAVDKDLLNGAEKEWLNNYHKKVYDTLSPLIDKELSEWLEEKTKEI